MSSGPEPTDADRFARSFGAKLLILSGLGLATAVVLALTTPAVLIARLFAIAAAAFFLSMLVAVLIRSTATVHPARLRLLFGVQTFLFAAGAFALAIGALPRASETAAPPLADVGWHLTGQGIANGISGIALVAQTPARILLLAVHDSKAASESRLTLFTLEDGAPIASHPLAWPDEEPPSDLEAIARVPGRPGEFLLLASTGQGYAIVLAPGRESVTVRARFKVPNAAPERQFEGFDLQLLGTRLIACWGDRGADEKPAELFWSELDVETLAFGPVESTSWRAPWPREHQRHLSELRLRNDRTLLVSASSDPGDAGPFASAVYIAGWLQEGGGHLAFAPNPEPTRLFPTASHKIEAFDLIPGARGGFVLGADDENHGGAIWFGADLK